MGGKATGYASGAFGSGAFASANNSFAVGVTTQASGNISTAVGSSATASGNYSVALGQAIASGQAAAAIGIYATASGTAAVALGTSATASGKNSVALGYVSIADRDKTFSIGQPGFTRQIVNVAAGTQDTDAVNVAQLSGIQASLKNIAIGPVSAILYGDLTTTAGTDSVAIGPGAAAANTSVALGRLAKAGSDVAGYTVSIGYQAQAGNLGTAIGSNALATATRSTALGVGSSATATNSVALGMGSQAIRDNTVSVGSAGKERQIVNVKAGTQDTDAVNVAQLHAAGLVIDSNGMISNCGVGMIVARAVLRLRLNDNDLLLGDNLGHFLLGFLGALLFSRARQARRSSAQVWPASRAIRRWVPA